MAQTWVSACDSQLPLAQKLGIIVPKVLEHLQMGLKADIEEVTQHWNRSPWRVKTFYVITLFLSTSSLASLSEAVIKWKGFVLDALMFYRQWISNPTAEQLARIFGREMPPGFVDSAVLYGLFFGAITRGLLLRNSSKMKHTADVLFMASIYVAMLYLISHTKAEPNETTVLVLYPLFVLMAYVSTKGAERVLAMAYMVIPALGVGIVAAIFTGLAK
ncbi:hypothetical protein [Hydrogenophaga sp.]|uniref:hypothetical protein n=1 Tax=Hydrogenophaga sp. TaxID=1904254 RepID=UPI0027365977|nr:hypothetical protein [Hydrogenophaga sp.]MDP3110456.1 hypothetical protein [Hydrogenophaga sp.]